MRLFKFVPSSHAVLNMARGVVKFTPIEELNDPSELTPILDRTAVRDSLQILRRTGLNAEQFEWLKCQGEVLDLLSPQSKVINAPRTLHEANRLLSSHVYDDLDYMERSLFKTVQDIRAAVGVLSLSERFDSLPMWAHYANLGKGFVVVFEDLEKCFAGDSTGSLNITKPVGYGDRFAGMTFDPSTQDRLFFSKLIDWSYEREWRVVTPLNACLRNQEGLYLREIDPRHVTAVICGWRASEANLSNLQTEVFRVNPATLVLLARMDSGLVKLDHPFG